MNAGAIMSHRNPDHDLDFVAYSDPLTPPATATIDDIRYAQQLRLQLRERYPDLPSPPPSFWCIGVD